jgi:hypothetical protein
MSIFFTKKKEVEPDISEMNVDEDEDDDNIFTSFLKGEKANARKKRFVEVE